MTREQECVKELCLILDDITEKAKHNDFSLFRVSGISGCDRYQGQPPICRIRDAVFEKYDDVICDALRENDNSNSK